MKEKTVYIQFDSNKIYSASSGTTTASLEVPTRNLYDFDGYYYDNENNIVVNYGDSKLTFSSWTIYDKTDDDNSVTINAKWSVHAYQIAFNANGGRFTTGSADQNELPMSAGKDFTLHDAENLKREGYSFLGWAFEENETNPDNIYEAGKVVQSSEEPNSLFSQIASHGRMYAIWQADPYTVTYSAGEFADEVTLPTQTSFEYN